MAFFKLRKGGDEGGDKSGESGRAASRDRGRDKSRDTGRDGASSSRQPESVEAMRKRARHRLIGAGVLVLIGVIGFPLLFDTQPRPIAVDIPIEIPDRNRVKPLSAQGAVAPAPQAAPAPARVASRASGQTQVASATVAAAAPAAAPAATASRTEPPPSPKPEAKAELRSGAKTDSRPEAKTDSRPEAKADPKPQDGARAQALLEGKPITTAQESAEGRYIVQVGAFSDSAKSRETRAKLERAGMKTYTHVAETKDGKLIRVRVGPFASKAEADKVAQKIKALDLSPHVLKL